MHYFDHASTSFPKPMEVLERIKIYLTQFGVSPGRGTHFFAQKAEEWVEETREKLAKLLNIQKFNHISFTMNATHSLNIVIKNFLKPNDHVLICLYSHNAVLRPLDRLKREYRIKYDVIPINEQGVVDLESIQKKTQHNTSLFIATGASNVTGVKADFRKAFKHCQNHKIKILFDSTQSLGYEELDWENYPIDFLVGTGHKTLLGPTGVGFLYVKNPSILSTYIEGGSPGNNSISLEHPELMPFKFEAGTINALGIIGLLGSLDYIIEKTFLNIKETALKYTEKIWQELSTLDNVTLYGTNIMTRKVPIISFNIKGMISSQVSFELDKKYNICSRAGIHCAPLMHKFLKTLPNGTVRLSIGHQNTEEDIHNLINALKKMTNFS